MLCGGGEAGGRFRGVGLGDIPVEVWRAVEKVKLGLGREVRASQEEIRLGLGIIVPWTPGRPF